MFTPHVSVLLCVGVVHACLCSLLLNLVTRLLIEWEDTLPYTGRLRVVRHPTQCYSTKEVQRILDAAKRASLDVVPLVQTFGHLEFVLKHDRFASMREARDNYMDLCPLSNGAKELVLELISQVL